MDHVVWGPNPVHFFTDYHSLLYVLAPQALQSNLPRYVLSKLLRWKMHLSRFDFVLDYIGGSRNVVADMCTR